VYLARAPALFHASIDAREGEMHGSDSHGFRELAQRSSDGIEVTLLWWPATNALTVTVVEADGETVFDVPIGDAPPLDGYSHPYANAALPRVPGGKGAGLRSGGVGATLRGASGL
jgi:hypothetical protein